MWASRARLSPPGRAHGSPIPPSRSLRSVLVIKKLGDDLLPHLMETVKYLKARAAVFSASSPPATSGGTAESASRARCARSGTGEDPVFRLPLRTELVPAREDSSQPPYQSCPRPAARPQEIEGMRIVVERDVYDRLGHEEGFGFVETFSMARPAAFSPPVHTSPPRPLPPPPAPLPRPSVGALSSRTLLEREVCEISAETLAPHGPTSALLPL